MNGTLAAIFVITSLTDMGLNECKTGCLARHDAPARLSFQLGQAQLDDTNLGAEVYVGYDLGYRRGPFQPTIGASMTENGATWVGIGAKWTSTRVLPGPLFVETSLMPGIYAAGADSDLGGNLQFRSSVGVGYSFDNGATLTVAYDHRSNADTNRTNPGLEVASIRYAIPF